MAVTDGYVHMHENGNMYVLTMDAEGKWSAMYQQVMVMVDLGTQGSAELVQAEDMSWWAGTEAVATDGTAEAMANDRTYKLWHTDGVWSARFEPATMEIKGTGGVMVFSREDDDMWDVESAGSGMTLAADGAGAITTSAGAMYRVSMMDGMLSGVRFDGAPKGDTVHVTVGLFDSELGGGDAQLSYIADDRETAFNEANTKLTVAGENISLGDLLGDGMASKAKAASDGAQGEFVKSAVDTLMDLRTEAELYAKYQAVADDDDARSAFDGRLNSIADRAQDAVDMIFGTNTPTAALEDNTATPDVDERVALLMSKVDIINDGVLPIEDTNLDANGNALTGVDAEGYQLSTTDYIRATQTVRGLNRLLDALSSADAFVAATKDGNNGVFEDALGEDAARKAFSANKSEYMVYFGTTENTRYGAIALKERKSAEFTPSDDDTTAANEAVTMVEAAAVDGTRFQYDGDPTDTDDDGDTDNTADNMEVGRVGAFSYATVNDTLRARNLLQTGGAVYTGGTKAATPAGTLYSGDMRIDVNFRQQSVFGRVSDLRDKDNNLWKYLDSDVDTIYLPRQNYNHMTQFGGTGGEDPRRTGTGMFDRATVVYSQSQGFSTRPTEQPDNARFAGRFIGSDGAEITGTWSLGQPVEDANGEDSNSNDLDVIFGSYGVTRQDSSGPVGPADGTAGGRVKAMQLLYTTAEDETSIAATFAGEKDTAGILRLGKRSTGGGGDTDNDFLLTRIFAQPDANPKTTTNKSPTHVSVAVDYIKAQRAIYVIYAEQVGGDSDELTDLANVGRQNAWKKINDHVRKYIFNAAAVMPDLASDQGDNPAVLEVKDVTDVQNLSSPLGSYFYPMTRTGRPDDDAALEQIDTVLAAFADKYAFEAALEDHGGGVFDSRPAMDRTPDGETAVDPFPLGSISNPITGARRGAAAAGDIFGRSPSETKLTSLSTAYTRFGVWYRRESATALHAWGHGGFHASPQDDDENNTGSTSPGSYAYSYLLQSTYRVDRPVATYPSNGLATYEGKTLVHTGNTQTFMGDALIRVTWKALTPRDTTTDPVTPAVTNSTIVPIFSNFAMLGNLDRLPHNHDDDTTTPVKYVDEITFHADAAGTLLPLDSGEALGITSDAAVVEIVYTDGTRIAAESRPTGATFNGKFVGSSGDGPLGILGTWKVPGFRGDTSKANDLTGSFGADLTSFETLLPPSAP